MTPQQIESDINFALFTQDTNELLNVKRNADKLTPKNISELIEGLNESYETIESKDAEINELKQGLGLYQGALEFAKEKIEALEEIIDQMKEVSTSFEELIGDYKEEMEGWNESIEEQEKFIEKAGT